MPTSAATPTPHQQHPLANVPRIAQIACGPSYSVAICTSGHVYVWGSNDAGQLGIPTPPNLPVRDAWSSGSTSTITSTNAGTTTNHPPNSPGGGPALSSSAHKRTSTNRDLHVQTFDSRHNVLLPLRLEAADHLLVQHVACGPNHLWCIGTERTPEQRQLPIGRTLYEVQEDQRRINRQRARESLLLSKLLHPRGANDDEGGATTEGTTTQTDDNENDYHDDHETDELTPIPTSPPADRSSSPIGGASETETSAALGDSPISSPLRPIEPLDLAAVAMSPLAGSDDAPIPTPNPVFTASPPATPASPTLGASTPGTATSGGESTTAEEGDDTTTHLDVSPGGGGGALEDDWTVGVEAGTPSAVSPPTALPAQVRRGPRFPFPRVWRRFSWGGAGGNPPTPGGGTEPLAPAAEEDVSADAPAEPITPDGVAAAEVVDRPVRRPTAPPRSGGGGSFRGRRRDPRPSL